MRLRRLRRRGITFGCTRDMPGDILSLYRQIDPAKPLQAGDRRYVAAKGVRGDGDLVSQLANAIRRSQGSMHLLFAGHRGAGKSTELLRLADRLRNPPGGTERFFVVYFEADEQDMDVNDVDVPDLLLAVIRHVAKALRRELGEDLSPRWLDRVVGDLKHILGAEVEFETLEIDAKIAKVTAAIKSSPDARRQVRDALEPRVSNLISAANEILDAAVARLASRGYAGLVLVVDNLDRIVLRDVPGSEYNTHEQLFINRGSQVTSLATHVVYTVPISMVFAGSGPQLRNVFSRSPDVLPMIRVCHQEGGDAADGMEAMREMVGKRLDAAGVPVEAAFDTPETLDELCRVSGGHVRNLFILLRSACDRLDELPITRDALDQAVLQFRNDFERALNRTEYFSVLHQIDAEHQLPGSDYDQQLLYSLCVLEYEDGTPWYAVNPVVKRMRRFQAGPSTGRPAL